MTRPEVEVRRHVVTCRTYGAGPLTDVALREALGEPFRERLGEALAAAGLPGGYWLLRRLDIRVQVACGWAPARIGATVAGRVVSRLAMLIGTASDGENLLWFPDRASFVSRYLLDLAEGWSHGRWEYAQFPAANPAKALVVLAAEEPGEILTALFMLEPRERQRVLGGLAFAHEEELSRLLTAGSALRSPARSAVLAAARELRAAGLLRGAGGSALGLSLAAMTWADRDQLAAAVGPAREVADLLVLLDSVGTRAGDVLRLLAAGEWQAALDLVGAGASNTVLPFVGWTEPERTTLRDVLGATAFLDDARERLRTPYGGIFLLVPLLDDLWNWDAATRHWPAFAGVTPARLARMLVLTAALGRGQTPDIVHDSLLRIALGVPATLDGHRLGAWVSAVGSSHVEEFAASAEAGTGLPAEADPDAALALPGGAGPAVPLIGRAATALLRFFGRRLPGMADASAAYLVENILDLEAWVTIGPEEAVVELGQPPLHVLLMLAGMDRGSFRSSGSEVTWTVTTRG